MTPEPRPRQIFFYIALTITAVLAGIVLKNFISVIVLSVIYSFAVRPIYHFFHRYVKSQSIASLLTLLLSIMMVFIPIAFIVDLFVREALQFRLSVVNNSGSFSQAIEQSVRTSYLTIKDIPILSDVFHPDKISKTLENSANIVSSFLSSKALAIGSSSAGIITNFFIMLFLVYFLTPNLSKIRRYVEDLSPLENKIDKLYIDRAIAMTSTVVKGTFIVALAQGMLAGLFMWLAGVDYVLVLTLAAVIASVIPVVGTGFITVPISVLLFLSGQPVPALIVFLGQIIVIANIDNIIRAELVARENSLHPALMLMSIIGGIQAFGVWGFIYGPVILILFITSLEIYQKHIRY